jgi:hypothetical protein
MHGIRVRLRNFVLKLARYFEIQKGNRAQSNSHGGLVIQGRSCLRLISFVHEKIPSCSANTRDSST